MPSPEVTLVLRIEPSENIGFKLLLGYGDYPSDENHVAQSQMPLEGAATGTLRANETAPMNHKTRKLCVCVFVCVCVCYICACCVYVHICIYTYMYNTIDHSNPEETYVWVLRPEDRGGNVGLHYLVVKPIVEAGVKSINATVAVTSIAAQCKFWSDSTSSWSENGCRVSTNYTVASCYLVSIKRTY